MDDLLCVATRSPDQTEIRIRAHDAPAFHCRRALSPLLGGPFLMSPRRRQSATPGPLPAPPDIKSGGISGPRPIVASGTPTRRGPRRPRTRGPSAGRFTRKWVFVYFYSQSIHTTPSSVGGRRLSTHARLQTLPSGHCDRPAGPPMSWGCLHCLSLISAWSDVRHHWPPPTRMPCAAAQVSTLLRISACLADSHFHDS